MGGSVKLKTSPIPSASPNTLLQHKMAQRRKRNSGYLLIAKTVTSPRAPTSDLLKSTLDVSVDVWSCYDPEGLQPSCFGNCVFVSPLFRGLSVNRLSLAGKGVINWLNKRRWKPIGNTGQTWGKLSAINPNTQLWRFNIFWKFRKLT